MGAGVKNELVSPLQPTSTFNLTASLWQRGLWFVEGIYTQTFADEKYCSSLISDSPLCIKRPLISKKSILSLCHKISITGYCHCKTWNIWMMKIYISAISEFRLCGGRRLLVVSELKFRCRQRWERWRVVIISVLFGALFLFPKSAHCLFSFMQKASLSRETHKTKWSIDTLKSSIRIKLPHQIWKKLTT